MTTKTKSKRQGDPGRCASCGAAIRWIRTAAGKRHPVDDDPRSRWVCDDAGAWHVRVTYETHFATCPDSAQWRGMQR